MPSALMPCPVCEKEVARSAATCPHCGKNLKTTGIAKPLLILAVLAIPLWLFASSSYESYKLRARGTDDSARLIDAVPSALSPSGELYKTFHLGTDATDVQRENLENSIKGQIVQWTLPVYEVRKSGSGYTIQTSTESSFFGIGTPFIGTFVKAVARTPEEVSYIERLKTDDKVTIKGRISGTFMRSIQIEPAIVMMPSEVKAAAASGQAPQPADSLEQVGRDFVDKVATPTLRGVVDGMSDEVNKATREKASDTSLASSVAASTTASPPNSAEVAAAAQRAESAPVASAVRPSFDCAKASSNVETMICSDSILARADVALADAYSKLIAAHRRESGDLDAHRLTQQGWIKSRNECLDPECVITKYLERINIVTTELANLSVPKPKAPPSAAPEAVSMPQAPVVIPLPEPSTPAPSAVQSAAVMCPNYREAMRSVSYPREAALDNIQGEVFAGFTVGSNGSIRDIVIKSSTNRVFNKPAIEMVQTLRCTGQGRDVTLSIPISFKLN